MPIECLAIVHDNAVGVADLRVIDHRPLETARLFSSSMWDQVGNRCGDPNPTGSPAEAMAAAGP